ncbi:hypothetical protein ONO86_04120 [Micromonospora noduli]|nr:hypothetical protein ONO86_04120 [Micromonospora noduli]
MSSSAPADPLALSSGLTSTMPVGPNSGGSRSARSASGASGQGPGSARSPASASASPGTELVSAGLARPVIGAGSPSAYRIHRGCGSAGTVGRGSATATSAR